ncbi:MAG TPA: polymer-forming cytoskeletal protein, partial [Gemmatimonadales bacterium]
MTHPAARRVPPRPNAPTKVCLMRFALLPLFALAAAAPIAAQDTAIVINPESSGVHFTPPELPREIADSAVRFYNAPRTTRLVGRTQLPPGNAWRGDVAVRNGPVLLGGRIEGSLLVIDGDLLLAPGAEVTGDVLVVGGAVTGADSAHVGGRARAFREPL